MHSRWYRSIKCRELMSLYYLAASPLCSPVHQDKGLTGILGPAGPARQKRVLTHSIWPPTLISMSTVKTLPLRRLGVDGEKKKKSGIKTATETRPLLPLTKRKKRETAFHGRVRTPAAVGEGSSKGGRRRDFAAHLVN